MPVFDYPYIRDELVIDQRVQHFYDNFASAGPVFLLGRRVSHSQDLRLRPDRPLVVVADVYDGTGGMIDASGTWGGGGGNGADGRGVGVSGDPGGAGGSGGPGGSATIYCRRSVNAHVSADGGPGGPGGNGGNGTDGTPNHSSGGYTVWVDDTPDDPTDSVGHDEYVPEEVTEGITGGVGGPGGAGGAGGPGGAITFTSISDDVPPALSAAAGGGQRGGWGGTGGMFAPTAEDGSNLAPPGPDGEWGAEGTVTYVNVSESDFVAGLRPLLGAYANFWAPFRLAVAEYRYHRYNPDVSDPGEDSRARDMEKAVVEVTRTLELQSDNADALRLQRQTDTGCNALGLDPDLDVIPTFTEYIDAFTGFAAMTLSFLTSGTSTLVDSITSGTLSQFAESMRLQAAATHDRARDELEIARTEHQLAADEIDYAQQRLDQASADIVAAKAEMDEAAADTGISFGDVIQIATAVVGVIAAVPTAGASLVTLVPAAVTLAGTVVDDAGPIAKAVFDSSKVDVADIEAAYKKVGKEVPAVVEGAKSIVNFVTLVEKISATATADNAKYVALVRRGAEMTHEVLLAQRHTGLAQQRVEAVQNEVARADAVVTAAATLRDTAAGDASALKNAGSLAVATAQSCATHLLGLAFRAQRAVEIYTLKDEGANLFLDAGMIHPDFTRAYQEDEHSDADLVGALLTSWGTLLRPAALQSDYTSYFDDPPDRDQLRLTFAADSPEVAALRATGRLSFRVDVADIPAGRYDAKIEGMRLALVGAQHPNGEISSQVRHGARYEQRRADGSVTVQLLAPRTCTRKTILTALPPDPGFTPDPPLTAPTSLRVWGRGVGGDWELSIPEDQLPGLDLSALSAVQVWLGYRFLG